MNGPAGPRGAAGGGDGLGGRRRVSSTPAVGGAEAEGAWPTFGSGAPGWAGPTPSRAARLSPMPVLIGGEYVSYDDGVYRVPKRDLARSVKLLLNKSWLHAANDLPLWELLNDELRDFATRVSISPSRPWEDVWRDGEFDDLVLAAALACWYALQY